MHRLPSLYHSLNLVKHVAPHTFSTIIDIGAQKQTDFLADIFPESHHILFEPYTLYHSELRSYYENLGIKHDVMSQPLYRSETTMWLHHQSHDGSGKTTHTCLKKEKDDQMKHLIKTEEVMSTTLDRFFFVDSDLSSSLDEYEFVIKLDVDGDEDDIIDGGRCCLPRASFIIVEASINDTLQFAKRITTLANLGFRLFDMCDMGYYFGQLSQVDLVFINEKMRSGNKCFQPWAITDYKLEWEHWQHDFKNHKDVTGAVKIAEKIIEKTKG